MALEMVKLLYEQGDWATGVLLDAAQDVPDAWTADAGPGMRPLRDNFVHMLDTVNSWLSWWDGSWSGEQAFSTQSDPADFPNVAAIRVARQALNQRLTAFLAGLSEADMERQYSTPTPWGMEISGTLWQMMPQLVLHGAQHRAEIAAILTAHGRSPGELDLGWYLWGRSWMQAQMQSHAD